MVKKRNNEVAIAIPLKLGLPEKCISCLSRETPDSMELGCQGLTCFSKTGGGKTPFLSLRRRTRSATKLVHIIAMTKEHTMIRSETEDGVFSLEAFADMPFGLGTNMWLKQMRKKRNTNEESPAMAAIERNDSRPFIAWLEPSVPNCAVSA